MNAFDLALLLPLANKIRSTANSSKQVKIISHDAKQVRIVDADAIAKRADDKFLYKPSTTIPLPTIPYLGQSCFPAGVRVFVTGGDRVVEDIRAGDRILSRDENDPTGPVEERVVEEVFVRVAPLWDFWVVGRRVRTTAEHPFYARGRGWVAARFLVPGDELATLSGAWVRVDGVHDPEEIATVYNFRVADWHTYFVGAVGW
ncbi:MAG: polymorphic toxin-type HINT domain-containing protein, partial [Planctomycetia bacterium]